MSSSHSLIPGSSTVLLHLYHQVFLGVLLGYKAFGGKLCYEIKNYMFLTINQMMKSVCSLMSLIVFLSSTSLWAASRSRTGATLLSTPDWRTYDKYNEVLAQLKKNTENQFKGFADPASPDTPNKKDSADPPFTPAAKSIRSAMRVLVENPNHLNPRDQYKAFIKEIRKLSQFCHSEQVSAECSLEDHKGKNLLVKILYTGTDMTEFNSKLTCAVSGKSHPIQGDVPSQIEERLKTIDETISSLSDVDDGLHSSPSQIHLFANWAQAARGGYNSGAFDPNLQGNLLSVKARYSLRGSTSGALQEHFALRIPTQTINNSEDQVMITPEFEAYVDSLAAEDKKHTYINHQDISGSKVKSGWRKFFPFDDERPRVNKLHDLSSQKRNLIVISLNKDSSFYHQKGPEFSQSNYKAFRQKLVDILVPPTQASKKQAIEKHGILLSDLWNPDKFKDLPRDSHAAKRAVREYMEGLVDSLAQNVFNVKLGDPKSVISEDSRRALIEIAYHHISDYASRESYSSNRSCKDAIDRGGGANAFAYTYTMLKEICESPQMTDEDFKTRVNALPGMLFSDALNVKKRAIIKERLVNYQHATHALIKSLKSNGCQVFDGAHLGKYSYLSHPKFGTKLAHPELRDPLMREGCTQSSTSPPADQCLTLNQDAFPLSPTQVGSFLSEQSGLLRVIRKTIGDQKSEDEDPLLEDPLLNVD